MPISRNSLVQATLAEIGLTRTGLGRGIDGPPGDPPPVAEFSGTPLTGVFPYTVVFTDLTTGDVTSWAWNFGDGDTSTLQNPSHEYDAADTYTVTLVATGPGGADAEVKTDYVEATDPPPVAAFSGTPLTGNDPYTVTFTDASTGAVTSYLWDFGDTNTSTLQNPTHEYTSDGDFTVTLTVTGPGGADAEVKTDYIEVLVPAPVAEFSGTPLTGNDPYTVTFTDESTGAVTSYLWDFGDTDTSTLQNPTHEYDSDGDYTVTLTVTGPGGADAEVKTDYVEVLVPAPVAAFSGTPLTGTDPYTVTFTDASTGSVTSYLWDFGDTDTSTLQNPTHEYDAVGDYTVTLTVTGPGGADAEVKTDYIEVTSGAGDPDWELDLTGGTRVLMPLKTMSDNYDARILFDTPATITEDFMTIFGGTESSRIYFARNGAGGDWAIYGPAAVSSTVEVLTSTRYDVRMEARGGDYELFVNDVSVVSGTDLNQPVTLEWAIGARRGTSDSVSREMFGRIHYFAVEDIDTPANTSRWNMTKNSATIPGDTIILDHNSANALTILDAETPAWLEVTDTLPTIPPV